MKDLLKKAIKKQIRNNNEDSFAVTGKNDYFQIFIELGQTINIDRIKQDIKREFPKEIEMNCSAVYSAEMPKENWNGGICLLIEVYW